MRQTNIHTHTHTHTCTHAHAHAHTHTHNQSTHVTGVSNRGQKLDQSYAYQQFNANVEEEESWIGEKQHLLSGGDYGDTMAAVQVTITGSLLYSV